MVGGVIRRLLVRWANWYFPHGIQGDHEPEPVYDAQHPHPDHVRDPEHYDAHGRYLWWGC